MGFLFGLLIGAIAGLLYAPKSGDLTREELRQRSEDLVRRADELQRIATQLADEAQSKGKELLDDAKQKWERGGAATGGTGGGSAKVS